MRIYKNHDPYDLCHCKSDQTVPLRNVSESSFNPRVKNSFRQGKKTPETEIERNRKVRRPRQEPLDRSSIVAEQSRSPTPRRNPKGEFVSLEPLTPPANRGRYSPTISLYSACPLSFSVPDSMLYDAQSMQVHACKHQGQLNGARPL